MKESNSLVINQSSTYMVIPKRRNAKYLATESADEVGIFLWGKTIKDYTVYKAIRLKSSDIFDISRQVEKVE